MSPTLSPINGKQLFETLVYFLETEGTEFRTRMSSRITYPLDNGQVLVYDTGFGIMAVESNHERYNIESGFGEDVDIDIYIGTLDFIHVNEEVLNNLIKWTKKE